MFWRRGPAEQSGSTASSIISVSPWAVARRRGLPVVTLTELMRHLFAYIQYFTKTVDLSQLTFTVRYGLDY